MSNSLGRRIFLAHLELSYRLGRKVSQAELGEMIAQLMGRETPFTGAAVSRWETGTQVPSTDVVEAIAALSHTDPGWISHGERSAAPRPRAHDVEVGRPEGREAPKPKEPGRVIPESRPRTKRRRS